LAQAVAKNWQLPEAIADAIGAGPSTPSALHELVSYGDRIAADLDAGRIPQARQPSEIRLLDELIAGLPSAIEAFAPPMPMPTTKPMPPTPALQKPDHALEGELRRKPLKVVDRRAKGAAELNCVSIGPNGIEVDSNKPFQESAMVRVQLGGPESGFEPWMSVALCVPNGGRFRVELELFSPTRETRERWRSFYED
jgi:hypothetical protein